MLVQDFAIVIPRTCCAPFFLPSSFLYFYLHTWLPFEVCSLGYLLGYVLLVTHWGMFSWLPIGVCSLGYPLGYVLLVTHWGLFFHVNLPTVAV
jgi:hypothetical protein